jgi:energy-coupling factor transporter ATP-binding protein EcfA2
MIKIDKIELHNFKFFIDDEEHNTFEPNERGMLIYGENGSGKSSLFKAFEFLTKPTISADEFEKNINIFKQDDTYLEFKFSNSEILRIDSDELSLGNDYLFIEKLSVPKPIIDYKSLLNVSYSIEKEEKKNLYKFFQKILEDYPIDVDGKELLKELEDDEYFEEFKRIIKDELFDDINLFLTFFNQKFIITDIKLSGIGRKVYLEIDFFNKALTNYQNFLNEARLSALAISVYFAIIKKQFSLLSENSFKILILDDLLISLDMNNRLNLINILKTEFSDFQIFFFTHDKGFFEILKDKMSWKAYEMYVSTYPKLISNPSTFP